MEASKLLEGSPRPARWDDEPCLLPSVQPAAHRAELSMVLSPSSRGSGAAAGSQGHRSGCPHGLRLFPVRCGLRAQPQPHGFPAPLPPEGPEQTVHKSWRTKAE